MNEEMNNQSNEKPNKEQTTEQATKKFTGKQICIAGGILAVLIALIVGIGIYNTPSNRLSRQLNLGNRYLEEQNYEQAIVEFDKAIAIDPMSVEAYLGKAEAYIQMGDLPSALETVQTGYDLTGDERLKVKTDEIQAQLDQNESGHDEESISVMEEEQVEPDNIVLPFRVSDIKIMGYDLFESHFDDLVTAFGIELEQSGTGNLSMGGRTDNPYGVNPDNFIIIPVPTYDESYISATVSMDGARQQLGIQASYNNDGGHVGEFLFWYTIENNDIGLFVNDTMNRNDMETLFDLPIYTEDTYDEWCDNMGIGIIKSFMEEQVIEEDQDIEEVQDYHIWEPVTDMQEIVSEDGWHVVRYEEDVITDDPRGVLLSSNIFLMNEEGSRSEIGVGFIDQVISTRVVIWFHK